MKIVVPTLEENLCAHFGHCESFSFVEVNDETNEILNIERRIPEGGVSCQSASWIAAQGAQIILAGGMGAKPLHVFEQNGVRVVSGCSEMPVIKAVEQYLNNTLIVGENSCQGEHHHCSHGHGEHHK